MSLQKRWVCGQSPEQRLWGPKFGSRLPVGFYTTHLEKAFLFSVLQSIATVLSGGIHCMLCTVQLSMQRTGRSGTVRNQLRREQLRQPQCKYGRKRPCQSQVQILAFKICLCSGSLSGSSTLQQSTPIGFGKSSWGLGHEVLSWRSEMLLQPLSCPAQSKVWQQLGQSFPLSLLQELFQFSPLTAVSRGTLGDMKELSLNPLTKTGKRDLSTQSA